MSIRIRRWTAALALCAPFIANSQSPTLQQLTDSAVQHYPVIRQKEALVRSEDYRVKEVRDSYLPNVTAADQVNVVTDNSLPGSYFPLTPLPSTSGGIRNANDYEPGAGNIASLYGQYTLSDFGLKQARIENATARKGVREADLGQEVYSLKLRVARAWLQLTTTAYRLRADRENTDRYREIFRVIKAVTQSGITAGVDSSLSKAELARTIISYNQRLAIIGQLKADLNYLTGVDTAIIRPDTLAAFEAIAPKEIPLQKDSTNPFLDVYRSQLALAGTAQKVAERSNAPKLQLGAGLWGRGSSFDGTDNYKNLAAGLGYQRFNYGAGLSISYDLFSGFRKRDRVNATKQEVIASSLALQDRQQQLDAEIARQDAVVNSIRENLQQLSVQLTAARDAYRQKVAQYRAGMINLVDLTNAAFVLYRSQTDFTEAVGAWYLSSLERAAAAGSLDTFIQQIKTF